MKKKDIFIVFSVILVIIFAILYKSGKITDYFLGKSYNSRNIYVYDITDDKEVLKLRANEKVAPASLTKIMTIYTALGKIKNLNKIAPIDVKTYKELVKNNASMAGFYGRENTSYRDLLYGTMLPSGGECACSLAKNTDTNIEDFVKDMNDNAKKLNLKNTHFENPEGMDEKGQYSSARDIGQLLKEAIKNENFKKIFTTSTYLSSRTLDHPNGKRIYSTVLTKINNNNFPDFKILGGKSGTTKEAGLCWATFSEKNNKEYIIVVMGVPFEDISNHGDGQIQDTIKILEQL